MGPPKRASRHSGARDPFRSAVGVGDFSGWPTRGSSFLATPGFASKSLWDLDSWADANRQPVDEDLTRPYFNWRETSANSSSVVRPGSAPDLISS